MRNFLQRTAAALTSGCCVYLVMAACSSDGLNGTGQLVNGEGGTDAAMTAGGSAHMGTAGQSSMPNGGANNETRDGAVANLVDAMANPVPDASAQSAEDTVVMAQCSMVFTDANDVQMRWAEADFPNKSKQALAALRVFVRRSDDAAIASMPPGYDTFVATPHIQNFKAAVVCGPDSLAPGDPLPSATFILPAGN